MGLDERPPSYPNALKLPYSKSVIVETHSNTSKISEIKVATFTFTFRGNFLLNLVHLTLSDEELRRRGGDKVKILGISAC